MAPQDPGYVYEWNPPTFMDILAELGLQVIEVVIAAGAYAAGQQIAYFFSSRRFYTQDMWNRRRF
jgi:hypothetical protein